jgi:hypothetical protein
MYPATSTDEPAAPIVRIPNVVERHRAQFGVRRQNALRLFRRRHPAGYHPVYDLPYQP